MDDASRKPDGYVYLSYGDTTKLYQYDSCMSDTAYQYATPSMTISIRSARKIPVSCSEYWSWSYSCSDKWCKYKFHGNYE